jgi:regulator of replication initiation timing
MELFSETRIVELEEKIDGLIGSYLALKEEHAKMLAKTTVMETENAELRERVDAVKSERGLIIDKVTKLLEKVEKVEL